MKLGERQVLATNVSSDPYWWEAARPEFISAAVPPARTEVVVIGAGITGLRAALTLSRAGKSVTVVDRDEPGFGASGRNAGFLGRVLKKSFTSLVRSRGLPHAIRVYKELDCAYQTTINFIASESIDCHATRCGRFMGATSAAHYDLLAKELSEMKNHLGLPFHMLSKTEQRSEFATDVYFGGAVIPDLGSVHPGLYHRGLMQRAVAAGIALIPRTEVSAIKRCGGQQRLVVSTSGGDIACDDVLVCTNGYTTNGLAWFARRLLPFKGYMAATEELPHDLIRTLIPNNRVIIDTNTDIDYFRIAPDSPRLIMGGATAGGMADTRSIAVRLHLILKRVLPDLKDALFTHVWSGHCAGTFDLMPHAGGSDGLWFAMGYNFAGVTMGSYLGHKVALQILGDKAGDTVFSHSPFPAAPLYFGNPWFMPIAMSYFHWQDARIASRS
jgi:glycine/D-amino acid oxidase-like deaminating enzyme